MCEDVRDARVYVRVCVTLQEIVLVEACMGENGRSWAKCRVEVAALMACSKAYQANKAVPPPKP